MNVPSARGVLKAEQDDGFCPLPRRLGQEGEGSIWVLASSQPGARGGGDLEALNPGGDSPHETFRDAPPEIGVRAPNMQSEHLPVNRRRDGP